MDIPKHQFERKCPKCAAEADMGFLEYRYCNGGCWDGYSPGSDGTQHLHWECRCTYEWLTLCADHIDTSPLPF